MDDRQKQLMTSVGCLAPIQGSVRQPLTCVLLVYAVSICAVPPGSNLAPCIASDSEPTLVKFGIINSSSSLRTNVWLACLRVAVCWRVPSAWLLTMPVGPTTEGLMRSLPLSPAQMYNTDRWTDRDELQLEVIMDHDSQIVWAIN